MICREARKLALCLLISAAVTGCAGRAGEITSLDVSLHVQPDGSLEVVERLRVRLPEGATSFQRQEQAFRHDGVQDDVTGRMNGVVFPRGRGPRELEIRRGVHLDARFHFPPTGGEHAFVLRYRLAGAVHTSGIRGTVSWRFTNPGGAIADARIALNVPPATVLLEDPWVEEAGFEVARLPTGLTARGPVKRGGTATPGAEFTIDTLSIAEPGWQNDRRRARDLMPAFIAGGLFLLVIGGGVVWMIRLKYPRIRARLADLDELTLPPAIKSALIERVIVARDLGRAAQATAVFGAVVWITARQYFSHLDIWPLAIPAGILLSALMFQFESRRMSVLYSARVRDGQTKA